MRGGIALTMTVGGFVLPVLAVDKNNHDQRVESDIPPSQRTTYGGPGDTPPPGGGGNSNTCDQPNCAGTFLPQCKCDYYAPSIFAYNEWEEVLDCMVEASVFVSEITIQNINEACGNHGGDGFADLCVDNRCSSGVDAIDIEVTSAFIYTPDGVPTDVPGEFLDICGLGFGVSLETGQCEDKTGSLGAANEYVEFLGCDTLDRVHLQVNCACFDEILTEYFDLGLFVPYEDPFTYMDPNSPVFVVMTKCCDGLPTCGQ